MSDEGGSGGFAEEALGFALAQYLKLVRRSTDSSSSLPTSIPALGVHHPAVVAMWHGQHIMMPYARAAEHDACARDGVAPWRRRPAGGGAAAARHRAGARLGRARRQGAREGRRQGAHRAAAASSKRGATIAMTADVPKVARVAGLGIVTLGRISGRPIVPIAVVTSRRIDFKSWDRASIGLPFGRGAIVVGEPIRVAADADAAAMEAARLAVQDGLDAVHARAYALVGGADPGAGLRPRRLPRGRHDGAAVARAPTGSRRSAAAPFAGALLSLRLNKGKEDAERLGRTARRRRTWRGRRGRWSGCTARASARRCRCCRSSSG